MPRGKLVQRSPQEAAAPQAVKGVISKLAAERAAQAGIDIVPLLRDVGLTPDLIKDPEIRIAVEAEVEFLSAVAVALQDNWLGFHLARDSDLREFCPFYYLMASSERFRDAFDCAARYSKVVNSSLKISREPKSMTLDFAFSGIERQKDLHQVEFWITYMLRIGRALSGRELAPLSVNFVHQREGEVAEMQRFYGSALTFGAVKDSIAFNPVDAEAVNVMADPFLHRFLLEYFEHSAVRSLARRASLRMRVESAITSRLPNGTAIIGNIASDLGMSSRTLSRRLAEEGATFSAILDELRSSLANQYLQDHDLSISQIAWLLGYTEVSSFAHAFQRWTGRSPTSIRRQIAHLGEVSEKHGANLI